MKNNIDTSSSSRRSSISSNKSINDDENKKPTKNSKKKWNTHSVNPVQTDSITSGTTSTMFPTTNNNPNITPANIASQDLANTVTDDQQASDKKTDISTDEFAEKDNKALIATKGHKSLIEWIDELSTKRQKGLDTELYRYKESEIKRLQSLKQSDLTNELDAPKEVSIHQLPTITKIYNTACFSLLSTCATLIITTLSIFSFPNMLLVIFIILFFLSFAVSLYIGTPPDSNDKTKINTLDHYSVQIGMLNMLSAIFKKMKIDKDDNMQYEDMQNKIEEIIKKSQAFEKVNQLNNFIKFISNSSEADEDDKLDDLTIKRKQPRISTLTQEMFESLFLEIEEQITDENFLASFLDAKQKYFELLNQKGFKTEDTMEFSYLLIHNLCSEKQARYRRNKMHSIVEQGIIDGIAKYTKNITTSP